MSHEDTDLSKWIMRELPTPDELNTPLFRRIIDFKPDF
jgi:succinate dehydrogenase flavin-adding protein (antitoxin of CptAB toxin-antitoxin module)